MLRLGISISTLQFDDVSLKIWQTRFSDSSSHRITKLMFYPAILRMKLVDPNRMTPKA